jgi:iron complex transport system ATP-binding protein
MSKLETHDVEFSYSAAPVLRGVSLALDDGGLVALVGPNGSGKTTLLRVLSGLLRPQRGQVLLDGQPLDRLPRREIARRVAVVPQEIAVPYSFSAREIVLLGRTPYIHALAGPVRADHEAVTRALQQTGTLGMAGRAFSQLSGGERQRVVVAMALAQEPSILLLDEPIVHLDLNYQMEVMELVTRLNRAHGLTILATLHDLNLAAQYFQRMILLKDGCVLADGAPTQVITAARIRQAYGAEVSVFPHPANQQPVALIARNK